MEQISASLLFRDLETRYGQLTVFANDGGAITQSLLKYGEWAENELSFLHALMHEGANVLDVGAYIGTHTLAFSRFVGPSGHVTSIEPQLPTFSLLKANVEANELANVRLIQAVASFEPNEVLIPSIEIDRQESFGSASLTQVFAADSDGRLATTHPVAEHETAVRAITIDSLELADCAVIKIDAEGMEELVLRGAASTMRRCRPIIYAEFNSIDAGLKTLKLLGKAGYRVKAHVVEAFNADNFLGVADNIFGTAREGALVGIPDPAPAEIENYQLRACELLLDIETADDLALALMNKPQYAREVLWPSAAARTGGSRCLEEADATRMDAERFRNDVSHLRNYIDVELSRGRQEIEHVREACNQQVATEREQLQRVTQAFDRVTQELDRVTQALDHEIEKAAVARDELERVRQALHRKERLATATRDELQRTERALEAKIDACMRQVAILHNEVKQSEASNKTLRQQADNATVALAQVYLSTSWRLTAPARAVVTRIRHLCGV